MCYSPAHPPAPYIAGPSLLPPPTAPPPLRRPPPSPLSRRPPCRPAVTPVAAAAAAHRCRALGVGSGGGLSAHVRCELSARTHLHRAACRPPRLASSRPPHRPTVTLVAAAAAALHRRDLQLVLREGAGEGGRVRAICIACSAHALTFCIDGSRRQLGCTGEREQGARPLAAGCFLHLPGTLPLPRPARLL
jgi:hypothetical protein